MIERKGFLTLVDEYIKENNISLKHIPVNLKLMDENFVTAVKSYISQKIATEGDALKKYASIHYDEYGNMYMQIDCRSGTRLVIKKDNNYVNCPKSYVITEEDFNKFAAITDYNQFKHLRENYPRYTKSYGELEPICNLINNNFKSYCKYIKYLDEEAKICNMPEIEKITFTEPELCKKAKTGEQIGKTNQSIKHNMIPFEERESLLFSYGPEKVIKATDTTGLHSYTICLYNTGIIEGLTNYAMVIEPEDSFKYTKTAFFTAKREVTKEDFKEKATEYVEYDREAVSSLVNIVRNCHSTIDRFEQNLEAILLDEYIPLSPSTIQKLQLAKTYPEAFHR